MSQNLSFGYEGDDGLGDRLLAAVLRRDKTATSSLAVEYRSGQPMPRAGERLTLVDRQCGVQGTVETVRDEAAGPAWELREDELVVVHWFRLV